MVKFTELLPRLFSKDSTELVKTGAESTKAAYLASWQAELDLSRDRLSGLDLSKASGQNDRNFKKLAEIEIDRAAATQLITALPVSDLVKQFNELLVDRLV